MDNETFDYIVIGAGASGSVVANRLSADPANKVLVLEAGESDSNPNISEVSSLVNLWGSELDWMLFSEPQARLNNREICINQGKVLGGSTALNAMMYVRGNRRNFDHWKSMGADGWGYQELLPYFIALEDYEGGASNYHGTGGPISVRDCPDLAMRSPEFLLAAKGIGYDGPYWDYNGERQENGAGLIQFHINKDGTRCSGASAFLHPIQDRSNLSIKTLSQATKILFEDKKVVGVEYYNLGSIYQVKANKEVIVSAGALLTPKLLMLSGIGPAEHLRNLGITVVIDLPGVGQNLQDHLQLPIVFRSNFQQPPILLTGNVLFVNTKPNHVDAPPDLQINFAPAIPIPLANILEFGGLACIFLAILLQPQSKGEVKLRSADFQDKPIINPNYLNKQEDLDVFTKALEIIRKLSSEKAFSKHNQGEILPGEENLEQYTKSNASTIWHPAGTCKIGNGADAVVDSQLRVHGIEGLRVADASVMPTITSGNTVAPCFVIGAKAADLILHK